MSRQAEIRVGISGWTYKPWRGSFYPRGLRQKDELAFAATIFDAIEINGTFYSLQRPAIFARWAEATPDAFVFAVKAPRFITHMRRLREPLIPLANFMASGMLRLGPKLGPILWQLPPTQRFDAELIGAFLALLPHDTEAASDLARRHDGRLKDRAWLRTDAHRPLRHALEIRHDSFRDPAFIELLRRHRVALVCADTVEWPLLMDVTADFVYCRLHGSTELYRSGYDEEALERWAKRAYAWSHGKPVRDGEFAGRSSGGGRPREVYLFFDNTDKLRAPADAQSLMRLLHLEHAEPRRAA
jgi:uncharacterized protein YecE (DUF72 family)